LIKVDFPTLGLHTMATICDMLNISGAKGTKNCCKNEYMANK